MTKASIGICVVGDVYVDVLAAAVERMPQWGNDTLAKSISLHSGGGAANTAIGLARLGVPTTFFGVAGMDGFADFSANFMKSQGVSLVGDSHLKLKGHSTGTCIVISGKKDRGFVSCMGANEAFVTSMIPRAPLFAAKHVHFAGYFNLPSLQSEEQVTLWRELKQSGVSFSFDPQFDATATWRGKNNNVFAILPLVDIFLPSEEELMGITGKKDLASAIEASRDLLNPKSLLFVKCGEQGAKAVREGVVIAHSAAFPTPVVDTTGAGDAFNAAVLQQYVMEGSDVETALTFGCAAGSLRVGLMSACDNSPSLEQVRQRVAKGRTLQAAL